MPRDAVREANESNTSEVRRRPGFGRDGGARRERAASDGSSEGRSSGVSQNIYMKPSSSDAETGFASSARSREVVSGVAVLGMNERNSPVLEDGSLPNDGRCAVCTPGDKFGRDAGVG